MLPILIPLILAAIGAGTGALTNLHNPKQMWKNAGIGAGIGGTLGVVGPSVAPSLLGSTPQAIGLGASTAPGYSLSGAASMPGMTPQFTGMSSLMGNSAMMGVNPLMASASGGTVAQAGGGIPVESLMKIMQFGQNPTGQPQQQPQPAMQPQPGQRPNVQLLQRILEEEQNKRRRMPGFSQDLFRLMGG